MVTTVCVSLVQFMDSNHGKDVPSASCQNKGMSIMLSLICRLHDVFTTSLYCIIFGEQAKEISFSLNASVFQAYFALRTWNKHSTRASNNTDFVQKMTKATVDISNNHCLAVGGVFYIIKKQSD